MRPQQTTEVVGVIVGICLVEARLLHHAKRMDEATVAEIKTYMRHMGRLVCRGLASKEKQVTGLQVTEIRLSISAFITKRGENVDVLSLGNHL